VAGHWVEVCGKSTLHCIYKAKRAVTHMSPAGSNVCVAAFRGTERILWQAYEHAFSCMHMCMPRMSMCCSIAEACLSEGVSVHRHRVSGYCSGRNIVRKTLGLYIYVEYSLRLVYTKQHPPPLHTHTLHLSSHTPCSNPSFLPAIPRSPSSHPCPPTSAA